MPPPRGTPNIIEGPGDYEVTSQIHNDTYPAINPTRLNLTGKAVLITGGSRGIGRAMALSYAKAGASHIAVGARSDLTQLAIDIAAAASSAARPAPQFLPLKLDITNEDSVTAAVQTITATFGKLDILINNAGVMGNYALIGESDPKAWWDVFDVNIRGAYIVTRAMIPLLLKGDSAARYVISVTSVAAHLYNPTLSAYEIAKLGLWKFTQLVNVEYAAKGITAFAIHPGNVPTDIIGGPENLPEHHKPIFIETPELAGDSLAFLTAEKRDWLGGRYVNLTWDLPELIRRKDDIVASDGLRNKFDFSLGRTVVA
ncbi:hypothetical protein BDV25DRAFT_168385 [Aspergillus avenaceus]|uniref:NAD(P)-binding protein n=1 Tax=Aspergillus avenaceus TaxID=36643 RepID=A0A5N6TQH5_ASPAV|nr:hypothetical protein BDV25DRAFT_168385 [Aspergillus avenaceus]